MKLVTIKELNKMKNGTVFSKVDKFTKNKLLMRHNELTKTRDFKIDENGFTLSLDSLSIIQMHDDEFGFRGLKQLVTNPVLNKDCTLSYAYDYDYYKCHAKEKYKETAENDFIIIDDYTSDDFEEDDLFIVYDKDEIKCMIAALVDAISL